MPIIDSIGTSRQHLGTHIGTHNIDDGYYYVALIESVTKLRKLKESNFYRPKALTSTDVTGSQTGMYL